ncbi:MAG: nicotinamide-nucleotide amidase [Cellvibrionaceae bacterium]|jgi:nicotinamide-nucleotide amidase
MPCKIKSTTLNTLKISTKIDLASQLGDALAAKQWRVTTAESCTGGGIAQAITAIPGSSGWFEQGFVTYSNRAKQQLLGVNKDTLKRSGAVSAPVAEAMATGALRLAQADVAVAVTGIAGPGGGSTEKPVGTVWIAWTTGKKTNSQCFFFSGLRHQIREKTVSKALKGLIDIVSKNTV